MEVVEVSECDDDFSEDDIEDELSDSERSTWRSLYLFYSGRKYVAWKRLRFWYKPWTWSQPSGTWIPDDRE